jgi:signal transduction histidine kinase
MSHRSDYAGSDEALRSAIDDIANQLAVAVDGRFEFMVRGALPDETLDKLAMLVNFVIEAARRALADLQERNARLAELDRLKSAFLANVSHELRTPLALILGPTERWLDSSATGEELRRDLEVVMRNARGLLKTVNDLLDVSKLEAGRLAPRYARVNLAESVRTTCSLFEGVARDRGIAFDTAAPRELVGEVDADMFQRVLVNLLSNAFKFGLGGGRIACTLDARGGNAVLQVQDGGPGIPSAMRGRIFERFVQVEAEATRRAGGTGLGLAIAKEFVELHGGSIEATDAPGGGALFIARWPLRAPLGTEVAEEPGAAGVDGVASRLRAAAVDEVRAPTAQAEISQPSSALRGVVLVVEDNVDMNRAIARNLSDEYRVVTASNGREALERIAGDRPDLVVTDVMMPEMSGDELVRAIREDRTLDTMPIVVLTAKADDALRVRLLETGAQDYVMKPFFRAEIQARVRNLIAAKRAGDALRNELDSRERDLEALVREACLRRHELEKSLDEVRCARDEVNRLLQQRDEFISVAGHELKTPLTPMYIQTQLLGRVLGSDAPEHVKTDRMRAYLDGCARQIETLTRLIETLLDVSRIRLGSFSLKAEPGVDLVEVARAVIARQRAQWEAAHAPVTLRAQGDPVRGHWDRVRLEQVVANLLSNAIKYGADRPIDVAVSQCECAGTSAGRGHGRLARLEVRDRGIGISAEDQTRIFNRFERAAPIRSFGGLGLGLYITRQIVSSHGGTIRVESEPGAGSTFIVDLPLHAPDPP